MLLCFCHGYLRPRLLLQHRHRYFRWDKYAVWKSICMCSTSYLWNVPIVQCLCNLCSDQWYLRVVVVKPHSEHRNPAEWYCPIPWGKYSHDSEFHSYGSAVGYTM
eukprot:PhF_6_TR31097/c0_g1_i1/m.45485